MTTPLEQFVWSRPVAGFQWETGRALGHAAELQQLEHNDREEDRFLRWRTAEPLVYRTNVFATHPTLFRTFADLEPTEEAFLDFANKYGALGVGLFMEAEPQPNGTRVLNFDSRAEGEPRWRWFQERHKMAAVSRILTAIQDEDIALLKQIFIVVEDGVRYEWDDEKFLRSFGWLCSTKMQLKEWLWEWGLEAKTEEERMIRFASGWAQGQINEAMADGTRKRHSLTSVRVLFNHEARKMKLHITPSNLLGAMWLQCARVLSENPTFRICEYCQKWFEVSPDARRSHAKYCGPRCKVAAYRKRNPVPKKAHVEAT
jgi:hypothetical protein